jgi:hypothetical protein
MLEKCVKQMLKCALYVGQFFLFSEKVLFDPNFDIVKFLWRFIKFSLFFLKERQIDFFSNI